MKTQYCYFPDQFDENERKEIIYKYSKYLFKASVGASEEPSNDWRSSNIAWMKDDSKVYSKISKIFKDANKQFFGIDVDYLDLDIQFTEYVAEEEGHYKTHIDSQLWELNNCFDRKLSLVILLNDPHEFEGGEFELTNLLTQKSGKVEELLNPGTAIVFPGIFPHKVNKITKGKRYTLVAWAYGNPWR